MEIDEKNYIKRMIQREDIYRKKDYRQRKSEGFIDYIGLKKDSERDNNIYLEKKENRALD